MSLGGGAGRCSPIITHAQNVLLQFSSNSRVVEEGTNIHVSKLSDEIGRLAEIQHI